MQLIDLPGYIQEILYKIIEDSGFYDYKVEVKPGMEAGDGFLSELKSVTIAETATDQKMVLVCKIAPLCENRRKEFFSSEMFRRESMFYNEVMPTFLKFQNEKNVPENDQFRSYPKCYTAISNDDTEQFAIIMEDIRPQGFKMWKKAKPARIENIRLVVQELGKFHGLSIAMKDQRPEVFQKYHQLSDILFGMFQTKNMLGMFDAAFDRAIQALKTDEYKDIMRTLRKDTQSHFEALLFNKTNNDRFGVVSHGDFWNNNILYRFNEDEIADDLRILDWQVMRYISPAIDLLYIIFSSTDKKLRDQEYENLLKLYHDSVSKMIKLLGSNPDDLFTFDNLKVELKRCGNYMLLLAPMLMSVVMADSSEISNLDEMCDKVEEGEAPHEFITGLNDTAQLEYDRRINDVVDDLVKLGYYQQIN